MLANFALFNDLAVCIETVTSNVEIVRTLHRHTLLLCCLGVLGVRQMVAASGANNMRQLLLVVVGACVR